MAAPADREYLYAYTRKVTADYEEQGDGTEVLFTFPDDFLTENGAEFPDFDRKTLELVELVVNTPLSAELYDVFLRKITTLTLGETEADNFTEIPAEIFYDTNEGGEEYHKPNNDEHLSVIVKYHTYVSDQLLVHVDDHHNFAWVVCMLLFEIKRT